MHDSMKRLIGASFLLAFLVSACGAMTPDLDFCRVVTAAPEYEGHTFRTQIMVVPGYHGRFAMLAQCKARVIKFAPGSFSGSPALQKLNDEAERAFRMREGPPPWKGVAVRVTARVEKVSSPEPGYVLRLLDADSVRLIDLPDDFQPPEESGKVPGPEPSSEKSFR
jgi:hypothetical protein